MPGTWGEESTITQRTLKPVKPWQQRPVSWDVRRQLKPSWMIAINWLNRQIVDWLNGEKCWSKRSFSTI
jgi:hypothetical protein